MEADSLATADSGNNLCSHLDGLCSCLQPPHQNGFCQSQVHLQRAARDICEAYVQGPTKTIPLFYAPGEPIVLLLLQILDVTNSDVPCPSVPISSLSSEVSSLPCFLKGPLAFPTENLKTACCLSAFILFAFTLLFWPRHLSF